MRKVKTLFKMDDNHQMTDIPNDGTEGVFAGDWIQELLNRRSYSIEKAHCYNL